MSHWALTTASRLKTVGRTSILPASIFARSRISLIISRSIRPELRMFSTYRFCFGSSDSIEPSTSEKPMMLLSGVRSSWLIVARKSPLSRFIS